MALIHWLGSYLIPFITQLECLHYSYFHKLVGKLNLKQQTLQKWCRNSDELVLEMRNTATCCELSNHPDCFTFWRSCRMWTSFWGKWRGSSAKALWGPHFDTQPNMTYCDNTLQGVFVKLIANKGWSVASDEAAERQVDLYRSASRLTVDNDVSRWLKKKG